MAIAIARTVLDLFILLYFEHHFGRPHDHSRAMVKLYCHGGPAGRYQASTSMCSEGDRTIRAALLDVGSKLQCHMKNA